MPRLRVCLAVLGLVIGFAAVPNSQQAPPPPPPPPPPIGQGGTPAPPATGTAFVAGQVVEIGSGQPVVGAVVTASMRPAAQAAPARGGRAGGAFPPAVQTDAQGRFYFANLPAGMLTVASEPPGFVPSAPVFVELGDGERVANVKVRIAKMGSVAGTIRDEVGDPVVGMTVAVFRRAIVNGRPGLQSSGTTRSDDRGAYRLGSVRPGEYLVCACGRDPNPFDPVLLTTLASEPINLLSVAARALTYGADVVSIDASVRTSPPTLHPNSQTIARATRVSVTSGEDQTGIDVLVPLVRATRVSGQVVGAKSAVQASAMRLIPAADAEVGIDLTRIPPMLVQPDGRFDFASVPPGQYRLIVTHRETGAAGGSPTGLAMGLVGGRSLVPPGMPPPPPPPAAPVRVDQREGIPAPLWADELLTVPDAGVSGLLVTLNQPASVRGRVHYIGAAPQPTEQMLTRASVSLQPISVLSTGWMSQLAITAVAPDGTYRLAAVLPGKYIVNPATLSPFRTLRSVIAGGVDITDLPLEVGSRDLTDIVMTMSDTTLASLTITAPGIAKAEETDAYQVLVFAGDQKYWAMPAAAARRMRTLPLSLKGAANATGLPAGDYYVALVTVQEAADWMDPARIEPLSRRAQRITLTDGEQRTLEVRK
jgi:hypothetical protein